MSPRLLTIDHVHVFVTDRKAAEHWYVSILGLRRQKVFESWATELGPLTISNEEGTVHLALFERPAAECRSVIAFDVSAQDLAGWYGHLSKALGEKPALEDHGLSWSLYFRDPDANPYEITSYEYGAFAQLKRNNPTLGT